MRLRSDLWVAALLRRAESAGCFGAVLRKGSPEAGAIFIQCLRRGGQIDLYAPAPQSLYGTESQNLDQIDRRFILALQDAKQSDLANRYESEARFDPDYWAVELEGEVSADLFDVVE